MTTLEKEIAEYPDLNSRLARHNRIAIWDANIKKEIEFAKNDMTLDNMEHFFQKLTAKNDFEYKNGYGFYLDGYTEFGVIGFMDKGANTSFEHGKRYPMGEVEFEVSRKSDLFHFLTWHEDKSHMESDTLKIYGSTKESYVSDIDKALFFMGIRFANEFIEEYGKFFYPRILDIRDTDEPCDSFEFSSIRTDLDWSCPATGNLALFNQGESTSRYNFFAFYRFIETFIQTGRETEELSRLMKKLETARILEFAKETRLIEVDGKEADLAKALYDVRNQYIYEVPGGEPDGRIPVEQMKKWKVVAKEISIQLLNTRCTEQPDD